MREDRVRALSLIDEAVEAGARLSAACRILGVSVRTIQRWRTQGGGEDERRGPRSEPGNKLSEAERQEVLDVATSPEYRDLSPKQIVPMLATLDKLGVVASFSRPRVSDDNPYSEALFRTLKYRPSYPRGPFEDIEAARRWVGEFVEWYNHSHLHSAIQFVTPADRHAGRDEAILERRKAVYDAARAEKPERWSRSTRNWSPVAEVVLNPGASTSSQAEKIQNRSVA